MPREIITVQVGQCGNQIGCRFWEMALNEHAAYNAKARYDEALSSFFQNVDARRDPPVNVPVGDPIRALKARAVVVDMEEGVTNELLTGPMRDVFDSKQFITGQSGSGNNWACGSHHYGPMYRESLLEQVRRPVEEADSLQSFMLLHSLGGGTGSGLGSYLLAALADEYPDVYRFSVSVFPSDDDDVVTSPYNAMLSCAALAERIGLQSESGKPTTTPGSLVAERRGLNRQHAAVNRMLAELGALEHHGASTRDGGSGQQLLGARDSRLTQQLAPLLVGSCRTQLLAFVHSDADHFTESCATLRAASHALSIRAPCLRLSGVPLIDVPLVPAVK